MRRWVRPSRARVILSIANHPPASRLLYVLIRKPPLFAGSRCMFFNSLHNRIIVHNMLFVAVTSRDGDTIYSYGSFG